MNTDDQTWKDTPESATTSAGTAAGTTSSYGVPVTSGGTSVPPAVAVEPSLDPLVDDGPVLGSTGSGFGGSSNEGSTSQTVKQEASGLAQEVAGSGAEVAQTAKDEARNVARDAADSGAQVAQTAKQEAGKLASEAGAQAKDLLQQTRQELTSQAGTQQQKVADQLRALSDELRSMAQGAEKPGVGADLAGQVADRAGSVAGWLESRDPGTLLDDVKQFARQKPGTFLAVAAGVGLLAGRLTRGLAADAKDNSAQEASSAGAATAYGSPYAGSEPATSPYAAAPPAYAADSTPATEPIYTPREGDDYR